jgi:hypothetical protein
VHDGVGRTPFILPGPRLGDIPGDRDRSSRGDRGFGPRGTDESPDLMAVTAQAPEERPADEPGPPRDEDTHVRVSFCK